MAIATGVYGAALPPPAWKTSSGSERTGWNARRCGHVVAQDNGVHALSPAVGEVPPVPGAPAEWNEGHRQGVLPDRGRPEPGIIAIST